MWMENSVDAEQLASFDPHYFHERVSYVHSGPFRPNTSFMSITVDASILFVFTESDIGRYPFMVV